MTGTTSDNENHPQGKHLYEFLRCGNRDFEEDFNRDLGDLGADHSFAINATVALVKLRLMRYYANTQYDIVPHGECRFLQGMDKMLEEGKKPSRCSF